MRTRKFTKDKGNKERESNHQAAAFGQSTDGKAKISGKV
jgi:hypothetical protein